MKISNKINRHFLDLLLLCATSLASCSKGDDPNPPKEKDPVIITATRIATAPRSPALGNESKMCYGDGKIYTFDRANGKFMSYDIIAKTWKTLAHDNQLNFAGYTGKMIFDRSSGAIYYLNNANNVYKILSDSWKPITFVDDAFAAGEAGYMFSGRTGLIYTAGGRMEGKNSSTDLRKYDSYNNKWEKVGNMPVAFRRANAANDGSGTMYIIGERENDTRTGVIFDTDELTVKSWSVPAGIFDVDSKRNQMTFYGNHLFYNNGKNRFYVYSMKTNKWLDAEVTINEDFLSGSTNLFVADGAFYAAGVKDGNFALYKLTVSFSNE